jgi:hypothetical protein
VFGAKPSRTVWPIMSSKRAGMEERSSSFVDLVNGEDHLERRLQALTLGRKGEGNSGELWTLVEGGAGKLVVGEWRSLGTASKRWL